MAKGTLKFKRVNGELRAEQQQAWNQPVIWPLILFVLFILLMIYPLYRAYQTRQTAVISSAGTDNNKGGR